MSVYYKQDFVSPEPIFLLVKEELKGYMDTGAVDDTLFPTWTMQCLRKLGKASYPINQGLLHIDTFQSRLPDDYHAIREAWACVEHISSYQLPSATYTQIMEQHTRLNNGSEALSICTGCAEDEPPDVIQAIYKTTHTVAFKWKKQYLLKPGNIYPSCPEDLYCANYSSISEDTYDVRDNKFTTSFRTGKVYIQYYSNEFACDNQLVPDNYYTQKFIELFLKEKIFEQLSNQATDESMKTMQGKYEYYKRQADEMYIIADTDNKKETVYRKQRAIKRTRNRLRKYDIN